MDEPKRYFRNSIDDFSSSVDVSEDLSSFLEKNVLELCEAVRKNHGRSVRDADGGPYAGISGAAFMCYYISRIPEFANKKSELLAEALSLIDIALQYANHPSISKNRTNEVAFLLGSGGIVVVAALIYDAIGSIDKRDEMLQRYISAAEICKPINFLECGGDEMLVGRAGYVCGCLVLNKFINGNPIPKSIMVDVCKSIIISGDNYTKKYSSPAPLMYSYYQIEYLGAGHGLSGILQILLAVPECLNEESSETNVKASIDFLLSLQTPSGNFPTALDELGDYARPEEEELFHWCHGAPGVIFLLARAYLRWKEPQYLEACQKCCEVIWQKGLLRKGPGICHGISGSGYAFLLMFKLTGDSKYIYRARKFAQFMYEPEFKKARTPDSLYSLYEGLAGTACYLADLIHPENAHFPLYDDIEMTPQS